MKKNRKEGHRSKPRRVRQGKGSGARGRGRRRGGRGEWEGDVDDEMWWLPSSGESEAPLTTSSKAGVDAALWEPGLQAEHGLYGPEFILDDIVRLGREGVEYSVRIGKGRRGLRGDQGGLGSCFVPVVRGGLGLRARREEQEGEQGWRHGWEEDKDDGMWETWDIVSVAESWCVVDDGDEGEEDGW